MEVRKSADRAVTRSERIVSRHSFAFGPHYDPENLGFGVLLVSNEDTIAPQGGYGLHPHRDMEIVTWVLSGALAHRDSEGNEGLVVPGSVQVMSAGRGVRHTERTAPLQAGGGQLAVGAELHMVQMWVRPDILGKDPAYAQRDLTAALSGGALVPAASGLSRHRGDALPLAQPGAGMSIAQIASGCSITLPDAPRAHLFLSRGAATVETDGVALPVVAGDAVRVIQAQGERVVASEDAELLLWEMHA